MNDIRKLAPLLLWAAAIAAASYVGSWGRPIPDGLDVAWKGSAVALLAIYAALRARSLDGWLLVAVMAFGAAGDMLLETHGLNVGGAAFLIGHLVAIALYLRNRRPALGRSQALFAVLLVPLTVALAWLLTRAGGAAFYALGLALMAATAWTSRFPRFRVGLGAILFVVSDLLIFARSGHRIPDDFAVGIAVWSLYVAGQIQIVRGVSVTLAETSAPA